MTKPLGESDILSKIRRNVLGETAFGFGSSGFLTADCFQRLVDGLAQTQGNILLDVGCGTGVMGLHATRALGQTCYVGYDADPASIHSARVRPNEPGINARFEIATFDHPPKIDCSSPTAVLAYDSLYLAKNLDQCLLSIRAVIPGHSRAWITAYVGENVQEGGVQGRVERDWYDALEGAGFCVNALNDVSYEWRSAAQCLHSDRLSAGPRVIDELGDKIGQHALWISRRMLGEDGRAAFLSTARRIEIDAYVSSD